MSALDTTTGELAERLGAELVGAPDVRVRGVEALEHAGPEHLTFIRDGKNAGAWAQSRAGAAVVTRGVEVPERAGTAVLFVEDADRAMIALLEQVAPAHSLPAEGVHPSAVVDPTATLGAGVRLGPGVWVGARAEVGDGLPRESHHRVELVGDPFEFVHLHVATPGPVGLAGIAVARILRLPVSGTYHTSFPEYATALTDDAYVINSFSK